MSLKNLGNKTLNVEIGEDTVEFFYPTKKEADKVRKEYANVVAKARVIVDGDDGDDEKADINESDAIGFLGELEDVVIKLLVKFTVEDTTDDEASRALAATGGMLKSPLVPAVLGLFGLNMNIHEASLDEDATFPNSDEL